MNSLLKKYLEQPSKVVALMLLLTIVVLEGRNWINRLSLPPEVIFANHLFCLLVFGLLLLLQFKRIDPIKEVLFIYTLFFTICTFMPCFFLSDSTTIDHCISIRKHGVVLFALILFGFYGQPMSILFMGMNYYACLLLALSSLHLMGYGHVFVEHLLTLIIVLTEVVLIFYFYYRVDYKNDKVVHEEGEEINRQQEFSQLIIFEKQKNNFQHFEKLQQLKSDLTKLADRASKMSAEQNLYQLLAYAKEVKSESLNITHLLDPLIDEHKQQDDEASFNAQFKMQCPTLSDAELEACWYEHLGCSIHEMAQKLHKSDAAIKTRLNSARRKIKEAGCNQLLPIISKRKINDPKTPMGKTKTQIKGKG